MADYTFGVLLSSFRKRARVSRKELADKLERSENAVGNWERDEYPPASLKTVKKIAELLNLKEEDRKQLLEAYSVATADQHVRGELLCQYDTHASWVVALDWEPRGARIVSAGGDGTVRVWKADSGEQLLTYRGHTSPLNKANIQKTIYTVAWSPDRSRIVSVGDGARAFVWNASTGQLLTRYQGHSGLLANVYTAAWSPDSKSIVSACSCTGVDKTIHVWDAESGMTLRRYDASYDWMPNFSVLAVDWSPDGQFLAAACGDKTIRVWDVATGDLVAQYADWSCHVVWSPDSRYLASASSEKTARVWDRLSNKCCVTYYDHKDKVRYVAWSSNGKALATASNDRTIQIWESLTGKHIYTYRGHSDWTTAVAWSPKSTRIASASNDKTVHIWYAGGIQPK